MAKETLIFVPGLLCDADLWRHQLTHLSDIADMVVADTLQDNSVEAMAERLLETIDGDFSLAGLSMGGYVAQAVMRIAPQRVKRLALVDTSARADTEEQTERRKGLIRIAGMGRFKGVTPRLLPMLIHPDHMDDDMIVSTITDMAERVGKDAFTRQQTAILNRPDNRGNLEHIQCPTLVIVGRQDTLTPLEIHQEIQSLIPKSRLVIIEDSGHLPPLEQPHAVTALLRDWLLHH